MARKKKKQEDVEPLEAVTDAAAPAGAEDSEAELESAGDAVHDRLQELEQELEQVRGEASEAADRALRTLAEFDNFRRRSHQEREGAQARGAGAVLLELLDVADNFDRALEHAGDDVPAPFLDGMRLIARGLHDLLDRHGVAPIEAEGRPFDPEYHEALTQQPVEGVAPNTVVQVVQVGYLHGERVLRPSKVVVAAALPSAAPASTETGDDE